MKKSCGNCSNFIRVKQWGKWRNGMCGYLDYNTKTDNSAHDCEYYSSIKYKREKMIDKHTPSMLL